MSLADELQKLSQLRDSGAINETEYNEAKARLLKAEAPAPAAQPVSETKPTGSKFFDPKANAKALIKGLAVAGAVTFTLFVAWFIWAGTGSQEAAELASDIVRSPQVIVDEEVAVDAGGAQARGFSLPSQRPIQVTVTGVRHTDKGFTVYLMPKDQWQRFADGKKFTHIPAFHGLKVRSVTHTGSLPPGSYMVVIQNSENILNGMVAKVRIVSDPK